MSIDRSARVTSRSPSLYDCAPFKTANSANSHASKRANGDSMTPLDEDDSELELLLELFAMVARLRSCMYYAITQTGDYKTYNIVGMLYSITKLVTLPEWLPTFALIVPPYSNAGLRVGANSSAVLEQVAFRALCARVRLGYR
jgi:hypothetical protein